MISLLVILSEFYQNELPLIFIWHLLESDKNLGGNYWNPIRLINKELIDRCTISLFWLARIFKFDTNLDRSGFFILMEFVSHKNFFKKKEIVIKFR